MRGLILVAVLLCCGAAFSGEEENPAAFDFRVVERIELACRVGIEKAESGEEVLACLRWRNGALAAIAGIAYQATVAWLAERGDLVDALEGEQRVWLAELDAMPGETRGQLEERAVFLHRRLAALMTITAGAF